MSQHGPQGTQEELPLFDFPLGPEADAGDRGELAGEESAPRRTAKRRPAAPNLHLVPKPAAAERAPAKAAAELPAEADDRHPPLGRRLLSGAIDLGVHALVLAVAFAGVRLLGVSPTVRSGLPFALFALVFSFLYCVFPLAFWGRTPGMALAHEIARGLDDLPLSFGQTILRWLGALLTLALAGLPTLLALVGERSLVDRLSGSKTVAV